MALSIMKVNEILGELAAITPPIIDLTVEHILSTADLDFSHYDELFKYLMRMDGYIVNPTKIVLCPNNHKCDEFSLEEPVDLEEIFNCPCGEEDFEPDNIIIVFNFTEQFKEESLKKKRIFVNREPQLV
jgi:hypothetical protein